MEAGLAAFEKSEFEGSPDISKTSLGSGQGYLDYAGDEDAQG